MRALFRRHAVHPGEGDLLWAAERLAIRSERDGQAHVVRLIGELDMTTARAFEDELKRVEATDARQIVVDLSGLRFIGSDGLKAFIQANARSRHAGNRLSLVRGPDQVHKTFETSGLISPMPFADDPVNGGIVVRGPWQDPRVLSDQPRLQDATG